MGEVFSADLATAATLGRLDEDLAERMRQLFSRLKQAETQPGAAGYHALVRKLKTARPATYLHSVRTARYARVIGQALGFDAARLKQLGATAMLHDAGKLLVPAFVLGSPRRPTRAERFILRLHPRFGALLATRYGLSAELRIRTEHHHERWDGKGYPHRVGGEDIPLMARVVQIADSFDAMMEKRGYNTPRTHEEAVAELRREAGRQFDPRMVEAFLDSYKGTGD
jgi:HD-GYP domain-containing protein (c-di-GMP phosphodiesterase class II)